MTMVLSFIGLPGCGKSTIARRLQSAGGFAVVSRDIIYRNAFHPLEFTQKRKASAFVMVLDEIRRLLQEAQPCIIDGMTFSKAHELVAVREVARECEALFVPIHFDCPVEVAQRRIAEDAGETSRTFTNRNQALVAEVASRFEPLPPDVLRVDATLPIKAITGLVLNMIPSIP